MLPRLYDMFIFPCSIVNIFIYWFKFHFSRNHPDAYWRREEKFSRDIFVKTSLSREIQPGGLFLDGPEKFRTRN